MQWNSDEPGPVTFLQAVRGIERGEGLDTVETSREITRQSGPALPGHVKTDRRSEKSEQSCVGPMGIWFKG